MPDRKTPISEAADLLNSLKNYPFLNEFSLALYYCPERKEVRNEMNWHLCEALSNVQTICKTSLAPIEEALHRAFSGNKPAVVRSPLGLLSFAVPTPSFDDSNCCLVGYGVRDANLNLWQLEITAKKIETDPFVLLEQLEKLPVSTEEALLEIARKVQLLLPSLKKDYSSGAFMETTLMRLNAIVGMSAEIDKSETLEAAVALLFDTIGILLDAPRIAIALPAKEANCFTVHGRNGFSQEKMADFGEMLLRNLPGDGSSRAFVLIDDLESCFPGISAEYATCIPLAAGGETVGMVAIFDMELQARDALLMELLAARVAAKVLKMHGHKDQQGESDTGRLLAIINELPFLEDNERLYDCILDMAAELVQASCGSLMIIDKKGENLYIAAAKRMNMRLAKSLTLKLGSGIAGKVAASGNPLLVNDIEHDVRIVGQSRQRFKSKSFVSIPIKFREQILGVLNLSDKENDGVFIEADLEMLSTFGTHASAVIRRSNIMERSEHLEHLSITDPLTELYNRRFLERRMEEELSRSQRQGLQLTVMLIDLDNFKQYNDLCGHIAGDRALQKVARILEKAVREMDVVTRYGGEEFCLVLPGTAKMESIFVAERIRRGIEKESFLGEEELISGRLTASIGISCFPEDGQSATSLINSADIALYQAKDQGRNRIVIFNNGTSREGAGFLLHAKPHHT